jgi:hypothetical protein
MTLRPEIAPARGEWMVGLASWVIQDGNYPHFTAGEQSRFALEFFDGGLAPTESRQRTATWRADMSNEIAGESSTQMTNWR